MAIITTVTPEGAFWSRTGTAQADTGQTDFLNVPQWARYCIVDFNLTAVAGTTPTARVAFRMPDLVSRNDTNDGPLADISAFTLMTAAGHQVFDVGPRVTGIADDLAVGASGFGRGTVNTPLPAIFGIRLTFDRAEANETYTYTISAFFRGRPKRRKGKGH